MLVWKIQNASTLTDNPLKIKTPEYALPSLRSMESLRPADHTGKTGKLFCYSRKASDFMTKVSLERFSLALNGVNVTQNNVV